MMREHEHEAGKCRTGWKFLGNTLAVLFATALGVFLSEIASATQCDCRPEFEVDVEGYGTCVKAKDDAKWCKIKFDAGETGIGAPRTDDFQSTIKEMGLGELDTDTASKLLIELEPDKWDAKIVQNFFLALFAVALWDTAPDRLPDIAKVIEKEASRILSGLQGKDDRFQSDSYVIDVRRGCLQLQNESFVAMVKTRFAAADRLDCSLK